MQYPHGYVTGHRHLDPGLIHMAHITQDKAKHQQIGILRPALYSMAIMAIVP
jgi:hypothetical protein